MKKIFILLALIFSIGFSTWSENKIVREDRIWEYYYCDWDYTHSIQKTFRMKFSGTETVNDTVYHKLVYTGKRQILRDSVNQDNQIVHYGFEEFDNTDSTYYLMREENNKVYARVPINIIHIGVGTEAVVRDNIVYDFGLEKDSSYEPIFMYYFFDPFKFIVYDIKIEEISETLIQGEKAKVQKLDVSRLQAVEGIGFTRGILVGAGGLYDFAGRSESYYLNRVYDDKGNIIFKGEDITLGVKDITAVSDLKVDYSAKMVSALAEGELTLSLYTLQGVKVAEASGSDQVSISASNLLPGLYIAKATDSNGNSKIRKIQIR